MCLNESEAKAAEYLENAFRRTFDDVRVLTNVILPMPEGAKVPTAEYDCLVICNGGIYPFEIKGWKNCLVTREKLESHKQWFLDFDDGERRPVNDPIAQGNLKLAALQALMTEHVHVKYHVLIPSLHVRLSPTLPAAIITAQDLPYVVRLCYSLSRSHKTRMALNKDLVELATSLILKMSEGHTFEAHLAACMAFELAKVARTKDDELLAARQRKAGAKTARELQSDPAP